MDPAGAPAAVKGPFFRFLEGLSRAIVLAFFDYRAEGAGNVPRRGGAILASTHQSHLDPILLTAALTRRVGYVARSTLFRNRLFGWLIRTLGSISFDREGGGTAELRAIVSALRSGRALIFFPEGTRSPDGEIGPLRPGIALLARRSGVPVVPVAVEGTHRCWPKGRRLFRPGRVRIVYGEPVTYSENMTKEEVLADLDSRLHALSGRARSMA
jgi:1-acyl-sn-glycerol-3-phosphate acyltransferase